MKTLKIPKPKRVDFEIVPAGDAAYALLRKVRRKYHQHLEQARVLLAWKKNWKSDRDGRLKLGRCMKASDLQRELARWDFAILLNKERWEDAEFGKKRQMALLDHELCHAMPSTSKNGEQRKDEKGRLLWRMRGHDIEEFRSVVAHHGCYKSDLEAFAEALQRKVDLPLLTKMEEQPSADDSPSGSVIH